MKLNPLAIFNHLKESTFVPAALVLVPSVKQCSIYTRLVPGSILLSDLFKENVTFERVVSSPQQLHDFERVHGHLTFSSATLLRVQEYYLKESGKENPEYIDDDVVIQDTSRLANERKITFREWKQSWLCQEDNLRTIFFIAKCSRFFIEFHKKLAPENALTRAKKDNNCSVCCKKANLFSFCGHVMCRNCRKKWKKETCPLCRRSTKIWFSNRFNYLSLFETILRENPKQNILFFDETFSSCELKRASQLSKRLRRDRDSVIECYNNLTDCASSTMKNPLIILSNINRRYLDYVDKYLRSFFLESKVYECRKIRMKKI